MFQAHCPKCNRTLTLARALPRCSYCGGELQFSGEDQAAIDAQQAEMNANKPIPRLNTICPICERNLVIKDVSPGDEKTCMYCSSLFTVQDAAGNVLAGPQHGQLALDLPPNAGELFDQAAQAVGISLDGNTSILSAIGKKALLWRLLRGHAGMEDVEIGTSLLDLVERAAPFRNNPDTWTCPLPPALAADLIMRLACQSKPCTVSEQDDFDRIVRVTTGFHKATTLAGKDDLSSALAKTALAGALSVAVGSPLGVGPDIGEIERYRVNHYLRIDLTSDPAGCSLVFSQEYATGESKPLDNEQAAMIPQICTTLSDNAARFVALKAVYGEWFNTNTLTCLHASCLHAWLRRLTDGLDATDRELSLFCMEALPDKL